MAGREGGMRETLHLPAPSLSTYCVAELEPQHPHLHHHSLDEETEAETGMNTQPLQPRGPMHCSRVAKGTVACPSESSPSPSSHSPLWALVHLPVNWGQLSPPLRAVSRSGQGGGRLRPKDSTDPARPGHLVGHVPKGEVGEGHAGVSAQREVERVPGHLVHLIVDLQQLCHGLQPTCGDMRVGVAGLGAGGAPSAAPTFLPAHTAPLLSCLAHPAPDQLSSSPLLRTNSEDTSSRQPAAGRHGLAGPCLLHPGQGVDGSCSGGAEAWHAALHALGQLGFHLTKSRQTWGEWSV